MDAVRVDVSFILQVHMHSMTIKPIAGFAGAIVH